MATKTFSSRADASKLAFADSLTRSKLGMSFGQYCGSVLLDSICTKAELPNIADSQESASRATAVEGLKGLSERFRNPAFGKMSDADVRELIARRYA